MTGASLGGLLLAKCATAWAVLVLAAIPAAAAQHVQVRYVPPSEVASYARSVVRGTIEFRRTVPGPATPDGLPGHVFTEIGLRVTEVWKGDEHAAGELVTFRHTGGQWGEFTTQEGPIPEYEVGQEWAVAILPHEVGWWVAWGLTQGAFRIEGDRATRDFTGLSFDDGTPASLRRESFDVDALREAMAGRGPDPAPLADPPAGEASRGSAPRAVPPATGSVRRAVTGADPSPERPAHPARRSPWLLVLATLLGAAAVWLLWRTFRPGPRP